MKRTTWYLLALCVTLALPAAACNSGDDEDFTPVGDTGGGSPDAGGGGGDDDVAALPPVPLESFAKFCEAQSACSEEGTFCNLIDDSSGGICHLEPSEESTLGDPIAEAGTTEKPELGCVGIALPAPTGKKVRIHGFVDRFGSGGVTTGKEVRVYDAAKFQPRKCDDVPADERADCYAQVLADPDALLGKAVSVDPPAAPEKKCLSESECPIGYACEKVAGFKTCATSYGLYEIEGMPTNTPVVVMVTAPEEEKEAWRDTFLFNAVFVEAFADGDSYRYDPTIVSEGQWQTVPSTLSVEIEPGNGAIGGRVRDCAGERESWPMFRATVGFATEVSRIGYFNDKETDTLPDPSRSSTNILGQYVGLDIKPGANWVTAAVKVDGEVRTLGGYEVYVFPGSLSVVSFPGLVAPVTQE